MPVIRKSNNSPIIAMFISHLHLNLNAMWFTLKMVAKFECLLLVVSDRDIASPRSGNGVHLSSIEIALLWSPCWLLCHHTWILFHHTLSNVTLCYISTCISWHHTYFPIPDVTTRGCYVNERLPRHHTRMSLNYAWIYVTIPGCCIFRAHHHDKRSHLYVSSSFCHRPWHYDQKNTSSAFINISERNVQNSLYHQRTS